MGARDPRIAPCTIRGSGTREAGAYGVPADELRTPGIQGDAGGRAATSLPGQGGRMLQLRVFLRPGKLFAGVGLYAHIHYRPQELTRTGRAPVCAVPRPEAASIC